MLKQILIGFIGLLLTGPFLLKCSIMLWFAQHRTELTTEYCVNIAKPELDCRATCYLNAQLALADGKNDSSMQAAVHAQDFRIEFTEDNYQPQLVQFPLTFVKEKSVFYYKTPGSLNITRTLFKPPQSEFTT